MKNVQIRIEAVNIVEIDLRPLILDTRTDFGESWELFMGSDNKLTADAVSILRKEYNLGLSNEAIIDAFGKYNGIASITPGEGAYDVYKKETKKMSDWISAGIKSLLNEDPDDPDTWNDVYVEL